MISYKLSLYSVIIADLAAIGVIVYFVSKLF